MNDIILHVVLLSSQYAMGRKMVHSKKNSSFLLFLGTK